MDKFTKTTEIDISNLSLMEEETPQKSKIGKVIAIIISLLLAVSVWVYVAETDQTSVEKEFDGVAVTVINNNEKFNITADNVSVVLVGTNSQLVDLKASDIVVIIDAEKVTKVGDYSIFAHEVYIDENTSVKVKNPQSVNVYIHVKAEK
ncbi:MAG: hypothetical protein E7596_06690 [Ruminococcaceae bacterium]|nr:hypothetical protein [Oscillospiraceae bacterium]